MLFKKKETPPSAAGKGIIKTLFLLSTFLILFFINFFVKDFFQKKVGTEFYKGQEYKFENFSITMDPGMIPLFVDEIDKHLVYLYMDDSKEFFFSVQACPVAQFSFDETIQSVSLLSQEAKKQIIEWDLTNSGSNASNMLCSDYSTNYIDLTVRSDENPYDVKHISYRLEIWDDRLYIFKLYCYIEDKETYQDSFSTWLHSILMIRDQ